MKSHLVLKNGTDHAEDERKDEVMGIFGVFSESLMVWFMGRARILARSNVKAAEEDLRAPWSTSWSWRLAFLH